MVKPDTRTSHSESKYLSCGFPKQKFSSLFPRSTSRLRFIKVCRHWHSLLHKYPKKKEKLIWSGLKLYLHDVMTSLHKGGCIYTSCYAHCLFSLSETNPMNWKCSMVTLSTHTFIIIISNKKNSKLYKHVSNNAHDDDAAAPFMDWTVCFYLGYRGIRPCRVESTTLN